VPVPSRISCAPTNYLSVRKHSIAISGQYFIDLSIPPVPQSVPHVHSGAENLFLHTTAGTVTADVWVTGKNKSRRASMKLSSESGNVHAKIVRMHGPGFLFKRSVNKNAQHDAFSSSEKDCICLDIELRANKGDVSLSLPHWFSGTITIASLHERIFFSSAFEERTALLSDVQNVRVYFVGDRPDSWMRGGDDDDDDKEGEDRAAVAGREPEKPVDKLFVSMGHARVRIRWDGEPELPI
jgi:hypothetical protein